MKNLKLITLTSLVFTLGAINTCFAADKFSEQQKKEIGEVVKAYLVQNPEVIKDAIIALQVKEKLALEENAKKVALAEKDQLFSAQSPSDGAKDPREVLVMFFDYQCSHCKHISAAVDNLLAQNKYLKIIYKELPIFGENSMLAAKAALAANKQGKYHAFHQALMSSKDPLTEENIMKIAKQSGLDPKKLKADMSSADIEAEVKNNYKLAQKIGLRGTPAFFITPYPKLSLDTITFVPGEVSPDQLQGLIIRAGNQ